MEVQRLAGEARVARERSVDCKRTKADAEAALQRARARAQAETHFLVGASLKQCPALTRTHPLTLYHIHIGTGTGITASMPTDTGAPRAKALPLLPALPDNVCFGFGCGRRRS